jgi:hypothetical protein
MALTAEQQEARKGRYTSTRVVKLYQGDLWTVYNEMLGLAPEVEETSRMRAGAKLQRAIVEWAAEDRDWYPVEHDPGTTQADDGPFASSPDALVAPRGTPLTKDWPLVVEAKNRAGSRSTEYEDGPLETDIVQLQWHMGVTGVHKGCVVVLLGGNELRHGGNDPRFDVDFDPDMFAMLKDLCLKFHREHVEPQIPPLMDASEAAGAYIKAKWPREREPLIQDSDGKFTPMAVELRSANQAVKAAINRQKMAKHMMEAALGDAVGVEGPYGLIAWKWQRGSTYQVTRDPVRVLRTYFNEED